METKLECPITKKITWKKIGVVIAIILVSIAVLPAALYIWGKILKLKEVLLLRAYPSYGANFPQTSETTRFSERKNIIKFFTRTFGKKSQNFCDKNTVFSPKKILKNKLSKLILLFAIGIFYPFNSVFSNFDNIHRQPNNVWNSKMLHYYPSTNNIIFVHIFIPHGFVFYKRHDGINLSCNIPITFTIFKNSGTIFNFITNNNIFIVIYHPKIFQNIHHRNFIIDSRKYNIHKPINRISGNLIETINIITFKRFFYCIFEKNFIRIYVFNNRLIGTKSFFCQFIRVILPFTNHRKISTNSNNNIIDNSYFTCNIGRISQQSFIIRTNKNSINSSYCNNSCLSIADTIKNTKKYTKGYYRTIFIGDKPPLTDIFGKCTHHLFSDDCDILIDEKWFHFTGDSCYNGYPLYKAINDSS